MSVEAQFRIALAQVNATVGDIDGNAALVAAAIDRAREEHADLLLLPELVIPGYPPEDLLLKAHFIEANERAVRALADRARGIVVLVGFAERGAAVHNSIGVLADGELRSTYRKMRLPNYGVFDEHRYFEAGSEPSVVDVAGVGIGLTVCEDMWEPGPPASAEALAGATVIVNASASPYHHGKGLYREQMFAQRARDTLSIVAFANLVGGQDELVFDGHSLIVDQRGEILARGRQFEEDFLVCDLEPAIAAASRRGETPPAGAAASRGQIAGLLAPEEAEIYAALVLGVRDYVSKNGFEKVVLGLSGGIDSALVALVATDALGPERVTCVVMPSPHSSAETQDDARAIARDLGVELHELAIANAMDAYEELLSPGFGGAAPGTAEENLQARIRGNLVMALSNRFGWLVLTTGNKSEMSVGYATLYGDMAGGFAVLKDVPKTTVYRLVRWRNCRSEPPAVPESVIERPPSAELRPDQRDSDSLPPYDLLDAILEAYIEADEGREALIARGFPEHEVDRVIGLVDLAEYKRRQAPPGIRISEKAFGRDRRLPITNRFRG